MRYPWHLLVAGIQGRSATKLQPRAGRTGEPTHTTAPREQLRVDSGAISDGTCSASSASEDKRGYLIGGLLIHSVDELGVDVSGDRHRSMP